jgi:hypothetical protein
MVEGIQEIGPKLQMRGLQAPYRYPKVFLDTHVPVPKTWNPDQEWLRVAPLPRLRWSERRWIEPRNTANYIVILFVDQRKDASIP